MPSERRQQARGSGRGFTLVELMIVIAIIAIVAAIAIPNLQSSRKSANEVKAIASIKAINSALEMRRLKTGTYAGGMSALQVDGYIEGFDIHDPNIMDKSGYRFARNNVGAPGTPFVISAIPLQPGTTGDRWFIYGYHDGVIRYSTTGPANSTSSPID